MGGSPETSKFSERIEEELEFDRYLSEVNNLNHNRATDGTIRDSAKAEIFTNLLTAVKEAAMPYAVSKVEHEYRAGSFMWLGRTAVQNASSGYWYHRHKAAVERVDVEVEEARYAEAELRPGTIQVFISPRMSPQDASYEDAKKENLADEDSVRISQTVTDEWGRIQKRSLESLLVRDVPLDAWVDCLQDPHNIFGKSINVEKDGSALSVMKAFKELELTEGSLPDGVVSIVETAASYIKDEEIRKSVERQVQLFKLGQEEMHRSAVSIAERWLEFEINLADSLENSKATFPIEAFINSRQHIWGEKDLAVIMDHQLEGGHYRMSRRLALLLEKAKQNFMWVRAGAAVGNESVTKQLGKNLSRQIRDDELRIRNNFGNVYPIAPNSALEAVLDRRIAERNIDVGGGCAGVSRTNFNSTGNVLENNLAAGTIQEETGEARKENWAWKKGVCVVKSCRTRPGKTEVGPCNVCRSCQHKYDKGEDPSKEPVHEKSDTAKTYLFQLVASASEKSRKAA